MGNTLELIGKRFGKWTVVEQAPSKSHKSRWKCICDCGNTSVVKGTSLMRGVATNCGCIRNELLSKKFTIDLIGQRFGQLVVLSKVQRPKQVKVSRSAYWLCKCDCGMEYIVSGNSLRTDKTTRCQK